MRRILVIIGIVIVSIISVYVVFLAEECIRLYNNPYSKPLIVLKDEKYHKINSTETYSEKFYSLGFTLTKEYFSESKPSSDVQKVYVVSEEFWLFKKFMIWAWIS